MTDRPKGIPPSPEDIADDERVRRDKGEGLRHVLDTGLPPGISVDEAEDPGKSTPPSPPKDRNSRQENA